VPFEGGGCVDDGDHDFPQPGRGGGGRLAGGGDKRPEGRLEGGSVGLLDVAARRVEDDRHGRQPAGLSLGGDLGDDRFEHRGDTQP